MPRGGILEESGTQMNIAFDNNKYLAMQSAHIRERIAQFDNKLYMEFGGKSVSYTHLDVYKRQTLDAAAAFLKAFAARTGAVVAVTGNIDIVADGRTAYCM